MSESEQYFSYIYEVTAELLLTDFAGSKTHKKITYRTFVEVPEDDLDDESGSQKRTAVDSFWNSLIDRKTLSLDELASVKITGIQRTERVNHFEMVGISKNPGPEKK